MKKQVETKKSRERWFYFVNTETGEVAKMNSEVLANSMESIGFRRCSYAEYLRVKKTLRSEMEPINLQVSGESEN